MLACAAPVAFSDLVALFFTVAVAPALAVMALVYWVEVPTRPLRGAPLSGPLPSAMPSPQRYCSL
jgi:hypothetical protein